MAQTLSMYNPSSLGKEALIESFSAREEVLAAILQTLRSQSGNNRGPSPQLIVGQRGQGKTTLLRRLYYAVYDSPDLSGAFIPLIFPEEQYNIRSINQFWRNCLESYIDELHTAGDLEKERSLLEGLEAAGSENPRSDVARDLLMIAERQGKKLLLLIDNLDLIVDQLGDAQAQELMSTLRQEPLVQIIAASSQNYESLLETAPDVYGAFAVERLDGFDEQQTVTLMKTLAKIHQTDGVLKILHQHPGRIIALRLLTGGNPRTLTLLFRILSTEDDGNIQRDLEELLDNRTPIYKARFEELPLQAQQLLDAMAINWDPLTAADLTARLGSLSVNQVSAQLKRLETLGVVERVDWFGEKKMAFQVSERLFNIWYLWRTGRRVRHGLLWLAKFLASWFDETELSERASTLLGEKSASANSREFLEGAFALAQVVSDKYLRINLEYVGIQAAVNAGIGELVDLSDLPPDLQNKRERIQLVRRLKTRVLQDVATKDLYNPEDFWRLLGGSPHLSLPEKEKITEQLCSMSAEDTQYLLSSLQLAEFRLQETFPDELRTIERLFDSLANGLLADVYDYEGSLALAKRHRLPLLPFIGIQSRLARYVYRKEIPQNEVNDASAILQLLSKEEGLQERSWVCLGSLLRDHTQKLGEAESWYRKALHVNSKSAIAFRGLGVLLAESESRFAEAEDAFQKALEIEPKNPITWNSLAGLLAKQASRISEAEDAYRQAAHFAPEATYPLVGLGNLLRTEPERAKESEQAFTDALAIFPKDSFALSSFAHLLCDQPSRWAEAEELIRKAIELEPLQGDLWLQLGQLLQDKFQRYEEAKQAYERALQINPQDGFAWESLGELLHTLSSLSEADEAFTKASEFGLSDARTYGMHGLVLRQLGKYIEASTKFLESMRRVELPKFAPALGILASELVACVKALSDGSAETGFVLSTLSEAHSIIGSNRELNSAYAAFAIQHDRWDEATIGLRSLVEAEETASLGELFRILLSTEPTTTAVKMIELVGARDLWRPLYEALRAIEAGSIDYLNLIAPELRTVAIEMLIRYRPSFAPFKGDPIASHLFKAHEENPVERMLVK